MVLHHFIHILPSPHEKLSDILYYISRFFVKIRLFTTNFHYLKVNRFFKKRQFLSVLDKTNVLFIDISENGFSPFFVDKVDNSVYKYIFRHLRPHFLWITLICTLPPKTAFLPQSEFFVHYSQIYHFTLTPTLSEYCITSGA